MNKHPLSLSFDDFVHVKTVGELELALKDFPDDTPIFHQKYEESDRITQLFISKEMAVKNVEGEYRVVFEGPDRTSPSACVIITFSMG